MGSRNSKEYMQEYLRKYMPEYRNLRNHAIRWYKSARGCKDCGVRDPLVLEFDHVRGSKSFTIGGSRAKRETMPKLLAEMAKCDVVCANCHQIRTHTRWGNLKPPVWNRRPYVAR